MLNKVHKRSLSVHFSSASNEWSTPKTLFDSLNDEFHFTLDPCSTHANATCVKHYTKADDGLSKDWNSERVYMNPPYGREIGLWVKKATEQVSGIVVMLLPARTDTRWFHEYIYGKCEIRFLRGRLRFSEAPHAAPFPSMIVIKK